MAADGETYGTVRLTLDGPTATVLLDRPAKRNAMSYAMWAALDDACRAVAANPAVQVVVVRGAGGHFCAGADIEDLLADRAPDEAGFLEVNMAAEQALADMARPTVAVIEGDCIGGGAAIAIDCDLRLAARGARLGITPAKLGVVYPPPSLERVVRLLGPAAKRLLFTGDLIDADEALRIGLVDEVHDPDRLERRVGELCTTLASRSLLTQVAVKEMVAAITEHGVVSSALAEGWRHEANSSGETAEGVAAFRDRRPPAFRWRQRRS